MFLFALLVLYCSQMVYVLDVSKDLHRFEVPTWVAGMGMGHT